MTEASNRPDVFLTQIDDAMDAVSDAIGEIFEAAANAVNQNLGLIGTVGGFLIGGIPGAIAGGSLGSSLEGQFDEAVESINEEWRVSSQAIRQSIGSMLGDPFKMSAIASAYDDAVTQIGGLNLDVQSADNYLSYSWGGRAHIAYQNTSANQVAALGGMVSMLNDASALMTNHAVELLKFWNQQLQNLIDLAANLAKEAAAIADAGNWLSFGTGVAIRLIATAAQGAGNILTDTIDYWIGLSVGRAGNWHSLDAQFDDRGLPGRTWPDYAALDLGNLNGDWEPATG